MAEAQSHQIDLLGNPLKYEVRRSADASEPRIDVDIHDVTVVVPEDDDVQPTELLKENAAWVVDKQRKYESYREQIPDRTFEAGERFLFLGEDCELVIEPRQNHAVDEGSIYLRKSTVRQSSVKQVLENFYRSRARETFEKRADYYASQMGVEYKQIEIRNQRTKWGSCSTTGTLGLNWRLMMAPHEIIDYIIIHELAHLRETNHNRAFWSLVREYDPNYNDHAQWLEEHSVQLIFSREDL